MVIVHRPLHHNEREREREREGGREGSQPLERDRQTDRQTDRHREGGRDHSLWRERERSRPSERERHRERETETERDRDTRRGRADRGRVIERNVKGPLLAAYVHGVDLSQSVSIGQSRTCAPYVVSVISGRAADGSVSHSRQVWEPL